MGLTESGRDSVALFQEIGGLCGCRGGQGGGGVVRWGGSVLEVVVVGGGGVNEGYWGWCV